MLSVCFLWHMHQPYYVDPSTQTALMPWVRLHAVKGYWDMIGLMDDFPSMRASFNLTPVLVKQIEEFTRGTVRDEWLEWSRRPASDLDEATRIRLLEHFFKLNWDNLVRPNARYWQLLQKRGTDIRHVDLKRVIRHWTESELRDLQVWFNLAWCGYKAFARFPELRELKAKGRGFTEDDKAAVLHVHSEILRQLLPAYRAVAERGQVELTTTPFFHPIMPLVYDTDFAKRCMPHMPLPPRFSQPADVQEQLRLAVEQHTRIFGAPPRGLWPSEGSVCPELMPLLRQVGIEWFATDEEILFRSLAADGIHAEQGKERHGLYRGYLVERDGATVCAAFRDKSLSDFIGFSASKNNPELAATFLVNQLQQIADVADERDGLAPIILDGENAWEYFPDGGERFLRELYAMLTRQRQMTPLRFGEYFSSHRPTRKLAKLHTGSWIRADFDIWIGDPEENRAWELLGQARRHLEEQGGKADEAAREKARWEIYAAEGSDWFWWYGPDFHTDSDDLFDLLFRRHLENVYQAFGTRPPDLLKKRIRQIETRIVMTAPRGLLRPSIDGQVTSFFEWDLAGRYDVGLNQSTMYRGDRVLNSIRFGFDLATFYLRLDFQKKADLGGVRILVHFTEPVYCRAAIESASQVRCSLAKSPDGGVHFDAAVEVGSMAWGEVIELALPIAALGGTSGGRLSFFVQEMRGEVELGSHPENGVIRVVLPSPDFELENWQV